MFTNKVRRKILRGECSVGCFMGLGSPNAAELLANSGLEWLVIETEHSAVDIPQTERILMAIKGTDTVPLVRLPAHDKVWIQRSLDIGAMGIVVPLVRTPAEAAEVVSATRFPPEGTRGYGPFRAAQYGYNAEEYFRTANENIIVSLIIETKEMVENLEEIASAPGIDVIHLGPMDLCLSLGLDPFKQPHKEVEEIIERMLEVSEKTGVAIGNHAFSPEQLIEQRKRGFKFISYAQDNAMIFQAVNAAMAALKENPET